MAKAKQLPSGQWRTLVYSHTITVDGKPKRIYESFTADTRRDSEYLAAKFALDKTAVAKANLTVHKAITTYIASRSNILSPSTVRTYYQSERLYFGEIKDVPVNKLTQSMVQAQLNLLSGKGLSPKTIRNAYGLLTATLSDVRPSLRLNCLLPQKIKPKIVIPTTAEVNKLISAADPQMRLAIKLAALLGLRRSEICGLTPSDVDFANKKLVIDKALVNDVNGNFVLKTTKVTSSTRTLVIPDALIADLEGSLPINLNPCQVTNHFSALAKKCGVKCRFHDLRHYYASVMLLLNIPDKYAMERMGHSTNHMLKTVYQHTFDDAQSNVNDILNNFFSGNVK